MTVFLLFFLTQEDSLYAESQYLFVEWTLSGAGATSTIHTCKQHLALAELCTWQPSRQYQTSYFSSHQHNKQTADNLEAKSLIKQVCLRADLKESSVDAWLTLG